MLGTPERGPGLRGSCRAACQARCGAVRTECPEPRRAGDSPVTPAGFPSGYDFPGLLRTSVPEPPRVNILCPIPGLQSTGHDAFWPHAWWRDPSHSPEAAVPDSQSPAASQALASHSLNRAWEGGVTIVIPSVSPPPWGLILCSLPARRAEHLAFYKTNK